MDAVLEEYVSKAEEFLKIGRLIKTTNEYYPSKSKIDNFLKQGENKGVQSTD